MKFSPLALACFVTWRTAAEYSINWHKIAAGGAVSTNGQFTVAGAIGQHDAGSVMTNGQFVVTGGFWVLPEAVQVEGAPLLSIAPAAPGFATLSWSTNTANWILQETTGLAIPSWTDSPSGSTNFVTVPAISMKFFRLRHQ